MSSEPWILCVEESRVLNKMVAQLCADLELRCVHARDTVDALGRMAVRSPAAIVAGFEQRDFSAASLIAALRSDRTRASVPIAVLTSAEGNEIAGMYQPDRIIKRNSQWAENLARFLEPMRDANMVAASKRSKVLLVEDSATTQRLAAQILHVGGWEVSIAANGQEALEMVAALKFDVILMDVEMPVMDGREAIRALRESGDETPVIAVTAHDSESFYEEARDLGFTDMYEKPIRRERLLDAIAQYAKVPVS